jgi:deoxycytidylate deaminase
VNSGISRVVFEKGYPDDFALNFFEETGVRLERYNIMEGA